MLYSSHHNLHLLHYDVKDKKKLYWYSAIRLFGSGFISVFIPALVYGVRNSLWDFFVFSAFLHLGRVIFDYFLVYKIVGKYGTKISFLISLPFLILFYWFILNSSGSVLNIYLAGLFLSLFASFNWIAFYYDFSSTSKKQGGKKAARFNIVTTLSVSLTTIVGGFLLQGADNQTVFWIASFFVALSSIPILMTSQKHEKKMGKGYGDLNSVIKRFLKNKFFWIVSLKSFIDFVIFSYWPLLIFLLVGSYEKLGIITTITTLFVMILTYYTGKLIDKNKEDKVIKFGIFLQLFQWFSVFLSFSFGLLSGTWVYFFDTLGKFSSKILNTSYLKDLLFHMNQRNKLERVCALEFSYHLSATFFVLFLGILSLFLEQSIFLYIPLILLLLIIPIFGKIYNKLLLEIKNRKK